MITSLFRRRQTSPLPTAASVRAQIEAIRLREQRCAGLTDTQLADRADELRSIALQRSHESGSGGPTDRLTDELLFDSMALVCAAATRTLGIRFYDVQIQSGLALASGCIAEMQTGEGKTFAAAFPAFVHSLDGRGIHIATSNEYLATRDHQLLRPLFECLNATSSVIQRQMNVSEKQTAYACDIVYGSGADFGFDYLRDQVALRNNPDRPLGQDFLARLRGTFNPSGHVMQRGLISCVVDEADNVLIDDACSPLLLSEGADRPAPDTAVHHSARDLATALLRDVDFIVDAANGSITITEAGHDRIWECSDALLLDELRRPWTAYVEQALRARHLFQRDTHYIIREGKVVIVDQSTGRLFEERTWKDGLHQAIEAHAGVMVTAEKDPIARITRQRFYRQYSRLSGMTGTATGSEREFADVYRLAVLAIPTHRPCQRQLLPTRCFVSEQAKWSSIARDIQRRHATGQPVLAGTRSIAHSLHLAERLRSIGVPFQLLNGLQDAEEASIIAQAGSYGAVTIATNMAGRGTDIKPDERALKRGGLHVVATEHHESSRVDRQLVGRAARQGEPGSAQFFFSADDDLIVTHGDWLADNIRGRASRTGEVEADLSRHIRRLQQQIERDQYILRKRLFQQEQHRDAVLHKLSGD